MAEENQQVMEPDLSNRRGQPQAVLYRNDDGITASGRFPEFPFYDFVLAIEDRNRGLLRLEVVSFMTGDVEREFTFDLAATVSDQWLAGKGGRHKVFPSLEDTSIVLVEIGRDAARWAIQRRINPDREHGGLI